MPQLRLGVYQLPQAEAGLVRALVTLLSADSAMLKWAYAESAPYDAIVVDSECAEQPAVRTMAPAILKVAPAGSRDADDTITRPIRAERLSRWLQHVERTHARSAASAAASPQAERFRLRKWPPQEVVRNDGVRVRMATMLSRRALSVHELADLSRQPADRCMAFVQTLRSLGLLEIDAGAAARPAEPPARKPAAAAQRTLVDSLRRRLGI
jgi:hypothetical protein